MINAKSGRTLFWLIILSIATVIVSTACHGAAKDETGRSYRLSEISKDAVKHLDNRLTVKAYFTEGLPQQFDELKQATQYLLREFAKASKGKIEFEFIDPKDEDRLKEEAQRNGVPPVNVNVRVNDKVESRQAYLGLAFMYNDKRETIPLVLTGKGLEYEITRAINKLVERIGFFGLTLDLSQMDPMMMFFMGQQQDKYQHAIQTIREHYELVDVKLDNPVPADVKTMVFAGTTEPLTTIQISNLNQYLINGNKIVIFQDRVQADLQTQQASRMNTNLFDFLTQYGVNVKDNLVMDAQSGYVNVQQSFFHNTQVQYPFIVVASEVNANHPIVSQLSNLQFLYVSEIDVNNVPADVRVTPLVYTSNQTGETTGPYYDVSLYRFMNDRNAINQLNQPRRVIAALYEVASGAKIVMVPDMDFIISSGLQANEQNMSFLLNAVDFLQDNPDFVGLRSREIVITPSKFDKIGILNKRIKVSFE